MYLIETFNGYFELCFKSDGNYYTSIFEYIDPLFIKSAHPIGVEEQLEELIEMN